MLRAASCCPVFRYSVGMALQLVAGLLLQSCALVARQLPAGSSTQQLAAAAADASTGHSRAMQDCMLPLSCLTLRSIVVRRHIHVHQKYVLD